VIPLNRAPRASPPGDGDVNDLTTTHSCLFFLVLLPSIWSPSPFSALNLLVDFLHLRDPRVSWIDAPGFVPPVSPIPPFFHGCRKRSPQCHLACPDPESLHPAALFSLLPLFGPFSACFFGPKIPSGGQPGLRRGASFTLFFYRPPWTLSDIAWV